ncbi:hypothetical protein AKJ59_00020 [candidate division MSBL1 archaeon SCGC-AAA385M02]|uniref:Uncharacterized protein n=1 Tax=candidate division MSBL1 archaeon SCGC-AAA385M02 TaxID=1698287 RepID=A0A133VR86_9EURY|nr:hypothetical protein AKJ59_00020 [candidate division MSBL1 archaeon SCGC-AAA385M02]
MFPIWFQHIHHDTFWFYFASIHIRIFYRLDHEETRCISVPKYKRCFSYTINIMLPMFSSQSFSRLLIDFQPLFF